MAKVSKCRALGVGVAVAVLVYVLSYAALSRYSESMCHELGLGTGFYYVPCHPVALARSERLQGLNAMLVYFYYPVWAIDHYLLDGPPWAYPPDLGPELPE